MPSDEELREQYEEARANIKTEIRLARGGVTVDDEGYPEAPRGEHEQARINMKTEIRIARSAVRKPIEYAQIPLELAEAIGSFLALVRTGDYYRETSEQAGQLASLLDTALLGEG